MSARTCPKCGRVLVTRRKPQRRPFLACPGFPACHYTEAIPETVLMRRLGHPELPLVFEEDTATATAAAVVDPLSQR